MAPRHERARELAWSGDYDDSIALYETLLAEQPGDATLRRELGLTQLWAGRELDAIPTLQAVVADAPGDGEARLSLGRAHYYLGDGGTALSHYVLAAPFFRDEPEVLAETVEVMRAAERPDLASRWLLFGLQHFPDEPAFRVARARGYHGDGALDDAARELEAVLADHPDHEGARTQLEAVQRDQRSPRTLGIRLGQEGHYAEARRLLRRHLREHPEDDEARLHLARFHAWSARYAEAQMLYQELLEARPEDRLLRTELAEMTSWRGRYGPARRQLEALIAEQPDDHRARVGLGNVHAWSGAHRLADDVYRGILAEDPDHAEAKRQLAHLALLASPSAEPAFSWFQDNDGLSVWTTESEGLYTPRPGQRWSLRLDTPRAEHAGERVDAYGFRVGFSERADERFEWGGELGAVRYGGVGLSPRLRVFATRWLGYRHALQLDLRHGDAFPEVHSIESGLEGVERSTAFLVHMYDGERFTSWTRAEVGRYSDSPSFWTVRSVLGLTLVERPLEVDLLAVGSVGDYSETSPLYYSPQDLLTYALGLRLKKRLWDRFYLVLTGEYGRIHSDGSSGLSWRINPELLWELNERLRFSLRYDHYQSVRSGLVYESDFVQVGLRYRFPVAP